MHSSTALKTSRSLVISRNKNSCRYEGKSWYRTDAAAPLRSHPQVLDILSMYFRVVGIDEMSLMNYLLVGVDTPSNPVNSVVSPPPVVHYVGSRQNVLSNYPIKCPARPVRNLHQKSCLLYTSPSPRDGLLSRMPSSA